MAGTDFGHAIGLPRALSGLPLSPLVGAYGELLTAQQTIGLSHLGELLVPPGGRLRVLDGIFAVTGPGRRRHVGAGVLRSLRQDRPEPAAARLLERLAAIQEADPAALRRILLYQLAHLLQDHPEENCRPPRPASGSTRPRPSRWSARPPGGPGWTASSGSPPRTCSTTCGSTGSAPRPAGPPCCRPRMRTGHWRPSSTIWPPG